MLRGSAGRGTLPEYTVDASTQFLLAASVRALSKAARTAASWLPAHSSGKAAWRSASGPRPVSQRRRASTACGRYRPGGGVRGGAQFLLGIGQIAGNDCQSGGLVERAESLLAALFGIGTGLFGRRQRLLTPGRGQRPGSRGHLLRKRQAIGGKWKTEGQPEGARGPPLCLRARPGAGPSRARHPESHIGPRRPPSPAPPPIAWLAMRGAARRGRTNP